MTSSHEAKTPDEVIEFWFGELDDSGLASADKAKRWWAKDPALDDLIRRRFGALHQRIRAGELESWQQRPRERLAAVIVLDQFSRNMFRDSEGMFASDDQALAMALEGIEVGMDRALPQDLRAFLYLPLMHAEQLEVQDRCVELFEQLHAEVEGKARERAARSVEFAKMHRDIVARFGRFPHRNALLGRATTAEEAEFLKQPGSSF
jgi:uncharacterized protein (DUF924 family)